MFSVIKEGALFQWLWEETHVPKLVGSNPGRVYWMDILSHILCCKNSNDFGLKKPEINKKEAAGWPIFF